MDSRNYGVKNIRFCKKNYNWMMIGCRVGGIINGYSLESIYVIYKKIFPFIVKYVCEFDTKDEAVNYIEKEIAK